jgi:PAS domain S-box-containing protein
MQRSQTAPQSGKARESRSPRSEGVLDDNIPSASSRSAGGRRGYERRVAEPPSYLTRYGMAALLLALVLATLYYASLHNILLFHSLVEIFRLVVAAGVFVVAYNTRHLHRNGGLVLLGVAYLHVAVLDTLHTLSFHEMGVFPDYDSNLPTQLWVAARLMQNASLLLALFYFGRRTRLRGVVFSYFILTSLLIVLIFTGYFPAAYVEGAGLTPFKVASEYGVIALSPACVGLLVYRRRSMSDNVFVLLLGALAADVVASLFFMQYFRVTDDWLVVGHYAILVSYFCLYKAIVETGLRRPFDFLFHSLQQNERELRKSSGLLRSVVADALVALFATDVQGMITVLEGHNHRAMGMGPDHALGQNVLSEHVGGPFLADNVRRALAGETVTSEVQTDDGRVLYLRYSPVWEGERVAGTIGVATDITEIKQVEEEHKWESRVREALADLYPPLISTTSIDEMALAVLRHAQNLTGSEHGYVASINPVNGDMIAHTHTAMLAGDCHVVEGERRVVFPQDDDGRYGGLWGHALNTRRAFYTNNPATHESTRGLPEGHVPLRCFLSVPVLLGDHLAGQIALANSQRDYTGRDLQAVERLARFYALAIQRLRAAEALRDEHNRAQQYLDMAADIIVAIDAYETITLVNRRGCELLGYDSDGIVGKNWFDIFLPDAVRESSRERFHQMLSTGQVGASYYHENLVRDREGNEHYIFWRNTLLGQGNDTVNGVLASGTDITERKRAEEMARRVALADHTRKAEETERHRLARELHDQVGGNLSLLGIRLNILRARYGERDDELSDQIADSLDLVDQTAQSIRSIMADLRPPMLDDYGLVSTLHWHGEQFSSRTGISVQIEGDDDAPRVDAAIEVALFRIVQEALSNVARHANASKVTVRLTQSKRSLRLLIHDDGVGFDSSTLDAPDSEGGWGLLNMVERARAVNGQCRIDSRPGCGTCIVVRVPR